MTAWQVLIDGLLGAAGLAALLFVSPVAAADPMTSLTVRTAAGFEKARELRLLSNTFDVRLLGLQADVQISRHVRNETGRPMNLAAQLPAVDERTEVLRIHRKERFVDLLQADGGCGEEADAEQAAGRARMATDEAIADALQLAPGETAVIETIATLPLVRIGVAGSAFRLTLPAYAAVESRALLVDRDDAQFAVVTVGRSARGIARLTLRPVRGAAATVELGDLGESGDAPTAFVIPLADRAAVAALAAGAIEIEAHANNYVLWSTLPTELRTGSSLVWVHLPE